MKMGHVMATVAYLYPKFWQVVVSEILFQYIYFLKSLCKNKSSLGGGISEQFCSNGGTTTHQILFYSR